jgi:hypothetical protein
MSAPIETSGLYKGKITKVGRRNRPYVTSAMPVNSLFCFEIGGGGNFCYVSIYLLYCMTSRS